MTTETVENSGYDQTAIDNALVKASAPDQSLIIPALEHGNVNSPMPPLPESSSPVILQTDEYGNIKAEPLPVENFNAFDSSNNEAATQDLEASWQALQTKTTTLWTRVTSTAQELFNNNRQLLTTLGWGLLVILGTRLLFAGLDAIDDIPLITPILKLIGLVYVVRFVWRYLLRQQNRHELMQTIQQTKTEIFGN